jgi:hypothetical protein
MKRSVERKQSAKHAAKNSVTRRRGRAARPIHDRSRLRVPFLAIDGLEVTCLPGLLHNFELSLKALRPMRDRLIDHPLRSDKQNLEAMGAQLGLFIRQAEQLIACGYDLNRSAR